MKIQNAWKFFTNINQYDNKQPTKLTVPFSKRLVSSIGATASLDSPAADGGTTTRDLPQIAERILIVVWSHVLAATFAHVLVANT